MFVQEEVDAWKNINFSRETFALWLYNWKLATAASKAAAMMLLTGKRVDFVQIDTPKGIILNLEPEDAVITEMSVTCAIRKDSGDDPDDTNGILIYATVEKTAEKGINLLGGIGIGYVTKPGLACNVDGPAINPHLGK